MTTQEKNKRIHFFGLFACTRTSDRYEKPCEEAVEVPYTWVDRRDIDDPMKSSYIGQKWYEMGRNHRVEDGMIARDLDDKRWMVRIFNENDLGAFIKEHGEVILLLNKDCIPPCYEIEIYDACRE